MVRVIPHTAPFFDGREAAALAERLASKLVNEGEAARRLVAQAAQLAGSLGGVPTSTGTLGLHLALKTLGVAIADDEVIIPDFACRCLYDCVQMAGGTPVFCDINLGDYSLDIDSVRCRLSARTRAVILPHMYGCPADIGAFLALDLPVVEDCAHALGATYRNRPVGSFGALGVCSFEGSKLVAAGEGGAVVANSPALLDTLRSLRYGLKGHFSYHYRLSDLLAAIALIQLDKLPAMIARRRQIAEIYQNELEGLERSGVLTLPVSFSDRESNWYRFVTLCATDSASLISYANERGVLLRNPLPSGTLSSSYPHHGRHNWNACLLATNGASLPITPDMSDPEIARVVEVVRSFHSTRRIS